jgi:flagellin-like hook-associated protein FlgL
MARIGSILSAAERRLLGELQKINAQTAIASFRRATGKRVNKPRDDPAAFVALSLLQTRLGGVRAAMANVTAASSRVTQAQSALGEIRDQLDAARTQLLKDEDRTLTADERAAAQAAIDEAIDEIDAVAGTAIDGRPMLNGAADYAVSGRNSSQVRELRVYATVGPQGTTPTISGSVTAAATQAELLYTGSGGQTTAAATFTLAGELGSTSISVANAEALTSVAEKINNDSHKTGVTASVDGDELSLSSVQYGSDVRISVTVTSGTFNVTGGNGDGTADGTDATAEINGVTYQGKGMRFNVNQNGFRFDVEFAAGFSGNFSTMTVVGDPLVFDLTGDPGRASKLAIPSVLAARLGGLSGTLDQIATGGAYAGLDANASRAIRIVDEALGKLDLVEGQVDGFHNAAITASYNLLDALRSDLEDAVVATDGYDEQKETETLAYYADLASNAVSGLTILSQQRQTLVDMLKQVAGLL